MAARVQVIDKSSKPVDQFLWHQRLGHPSFSVLSFLPMSFNKTAPHSPCDICFEAKQTREVFYESLNKTKECFQLIHCDVWGPYRTRSSSGAVYFLTIVDDFSRSVWTCLLLEKSEVRTVLQKFCQMTSKQFSKDVKTVCSDNGTEFMCLASFFRENGILHQTSCVATPQPNGRVERKHRHILNVARSLLFQSNLSIKFWGEAIMTATHLINRTPSAVLQNRSPYEKLDYSYLPVFGSLCFVHHRARDKDKFGKRSRRCIFVGYPHAQKGWKVFDLVTEKFLISRDVVFLEHEFPFASLTPTHQPTVTTIDEDWEIIPSKDRGSSSLPQDSTPDPVSSVEANT